MEYYSDLEAFMEFYQEPHDFEKTFFLIYKRLWRIYRQR